MCLVRRADHRFHVASTVDVILREAKDLNHSVENYRSDVSDGRHDLPRIVSRGEICFDGLLSTGDWQVPYFPATTTDVVVVFPVSAK